MNRRECLSTAASPGEGNIAFVCRRAKLPLRFGHALINALDGDAEAAFKVIQRVGECHADWTVLDPLFTAGTKDVACSGSLYPRPNGAPSLRHVPGFLVGVLQADGNGRLILCPPGSVFDNAETISKSQRVRQFARVVIAPPPSPCWRGALVWLLTWKRLPSLDAREGSRAGQFIYECFEKDVVVLRQSERTHRTDLTFFSVEDLVEKLPPVLGGKSQAPSAVHPKDVIHVHGLVRSKSVILSARSGKPAFLVQLSSVANLKGSHAAVFIVFAGKDAIRWWPFIHVNRVARISHLRFAVLPSLQACQVLRAADKSVSVSDSGVVSSKIAADRGRQPRCKDRRRWEDALFVTRKRIRTTDQLQSITQRSPPSAAIVRVQVLSYTGYVTNSKGDGRIEMDGGVLLHLGSCSGWWTGLGELATCIRKSSAITLTNALVVSRGPRSFALFPTARSSVDVCHFGEVKLSAFENSGNLVTYVTFGKSPWRNVWKRLNPHEILWADELYDSLRTKFGLWLGAISGNEQSSTLPGSPCITDAVLLGDSSDEAGLVLHIMSIFGHEGRRVLANRNTYADFILGRIESYDSLTYDASPVDIRAPFAFVPTVQVVLSCLQALQHSIAYRRKCWNCRLARNCQVALFPAEVAVAIELIGSWAGKANTGSHFSNPVSNDLNVCSGTCLTSKSFLSKDWLNCNSSSNMSVMGLLEAQTTAGTVALRLCDSSGSVDLSVLGPFSPVQLGAMVHIERFYVRVRTGIAPRARISITVDAKDIGVVVPGPYGPDVRTMAAASVTRRTSGSCLAKGSRVASIDADRQSIDEPAVRSDRHSQLLCSQFVGLGEECGVKASFRIVKTGSMASSIPSNSLHADQDRRPVMALFVTNVSVAFTRLNALQHCVDAPVCEGDMRGSDLCVEDIRFSVHGWLLGVKESRSNLTGDWKLFGFSKIGVPKVRVGFCGESAILITPALHAGHLYAISCGHDSMVARNVVQEVTRLDSRSPETDSIQWTVACGKERLWVEHLDDGWLLCTGVYRGGASDYVRNSSSRHTETPRMWNSLDSESITYLRDKWKQGCVSVTFSVREILLHPAVVFCGVSPVSTYPGSLRISGILAEIRDLPRKSSDESAHKLLRLRDETLPVLFVEVVVKPNVLIPASVQTGVRICIGGVIFSSADLSEGDQRKYYSHQEMDLNHAAIGWMCDDDLQWGSTPSIGLAEEGMESASRRSRELVCCGRPVELNVVLQHVKKTFLQYYTDANPSCRASTKLRSCHVSSDTDATRIGNRYVGPNRGRQSRVGLTALSIMYLVSGSFFCEEGSSEYESCRNCECDSRRIGAVILLVVEDGTALADMVCEDFAVAAELLLLSSEEADIVRRAARKFGRIDFVSNAGYPPSIEGEEHYGKKCANRKSSKPSACMSSAEDACVFLQSCAERAKRDLVAMVQSVGEKDISRGGSVLPSRAGMPSSQVLATDGVYLGFGKKLFTAVAHSRCRARVRCLAIFEICSWSAGSEGFLQDARSALGSSNIPSHRSLSSSIWLKYTSGNEHTATAIT